MTNSARYCTWKPNYILGSYLGWGLGWTPFFSFIFLSRFYTYFIIQYSSRLSSRAGPDLNEWYLLLLGCTGRGLTGWESNRGLEINSHQVRIEPGTGLQQSSVLTTELLDPPCWTPWGCALARTNQTGWEHLQVHGPVERVMCFKMMDISVLSYCILDSSSMFPFHLSNN
jgi:hypothetical protein